MNLILGISVTHPPPPAGGGAAAYTPELDFGDARNSMYLYLLLEEYLM